MDTWKEIRRFTAVEGLKEGLRTANPEYEKYLDVYLDYSKQFSIEEIKTQYLENCEMISNETCELGLTSYRVYQQNLIRDSKWFADTIELPFENTTKLCPKHYEEVIQRQYGDWRTPVYNKECHEMYYYDAERPNKECLS